MTKSEFITTELAKYDIRKEKPFRIAVSSNNDGADHAYGVHSAETEQFTDATVGFAHQIPEACEFLAIAWEKAAAQNVKYAH